MMIELLVISLVPYSLTYAYLPYPVIQMCKMISVVGRTTNDKGIRQGAGALYDGDPRG